jgi:MoaA/NifB/PqqE/SkfB family radical SAM enzyme
MAPLEDVSKIMLIEDDITTKFHNYTPQADHPDWLTLNSETKKLFKIFLPLLSPPQPKTEEVLRKIKSYSTAIKNYIDNNRLEKKNRHDLWPLYFLWSTHHLCNFRCYYCDDHRGNMYPDLPNEHVLDTNRAIKILKIMRTRTPSVLFAGGEPTLRNDLPEICRAARELNYYPIIIDTNASLIHKILKRTGWSSWLADIDHLVVSLDSLNLITLSQMWKCKQPLDVIRNILLLRLLSHAMRFKLMINTVIQPGFISHAKDVLNFCNDLRICFCPMPMNVGPTIEKSLLNDPAYPHFIDIVLERKREGFPMAGTARINERMLKGITLNCRNTLKPDIDYDGKLFWPCKASVNVKPVMINVFDFENVDEMYKYASKMIDPTNFQSKCGAKCNWSQHYSTDSYVYGLKNTRYLFQELRSFLSAT